MNPNPQFQIAERAYFIWEQKGCPEGKELENWLEAEAELSKEKTMQLASVAAAVPQAKRPQRTKRSKLPDDRTTPATPSLLM